MLNPGYNQALRAIKPKVVMFTHPGDSVRPTAVGLMNELRDRGCEVIEMTLGELEIRNVSPVPNRPQWQFYHRRTGEQIKADAMGMWQISVPPQIRTAITELFEFAGYEVYNSALGQSTADDKVESHLLAGNYGLTAPRFAKLSVAGRWEDLDTEMDIDRSSIEIGLPFFLPDTRSLLPWGEVAGNPYHSLPLESPLIPYPVVVKGWPSSDGLGVELAEGPEALRDHVVRFGHAGMTQFEVEEFYQFDFDYRVTVNRLRNPIFGRRSTAFGFATNRSGVPVEPVPPNEIPEGLWELACLLPYITNLPDSVGADIAGPLPGFSKKDPRGFVLFEPNNLGGLQKVRATDGRNPHAMVIDSWMEGLVMRILRKDGFLPRHRDFTVDQSVINYYTAFVLNKQGLMPMTKAQMWQSRRRYGTIGLPKTSLLGPIPLTSFPELNRHILAAHAAATSNMHEDFEAKLGGFDNNSLPLLTSTEARHREQFRMAAKDAAALEIAALAGLN